MKNCPFACWIALLALGFAACGKKEVVEEKDSKTQLYELRMNAASMEEYLQKHTATLQAQYDQLNRKRTGLNSKDPEAVKAFNQEATDYAQAKKDLDTMRAKYVALQDRIKELSGSPATPATLPKIDHHSNTTVPTAPKISSETVIYVKKLDPASMMLRTYINGRRIPHREVYIDSSPEAKKEWEALGKSILPTVVTNGQVLEGYNKEQLDAAFPGGEPEY